MFEFLNTFSQYLKYQEKVKVLSCAFYMIMVGKFGKCLVPDYAMRFLDFGFNLRHYYEGKLDYDILDLLEMGDKDPAMFEEEERFMI